MAFRSILFQTTDQSTIKEAPEEPACFADLNLDQVIKAITASKQEYDLKPFYYAPVKDADTIKYRQEIARDLENDALWQSIETFALKMSAVRRYRVMLDKLTYKCHQEGWFLETVDTYCQAVGRLADDLSRIDLRSRGFLAFRDYLTDYVRSAGFQALLAETKAVRDDLASVKYCILIKGNRIRVRQYDAEIDYSTDIAETFAKFQQGAVKDYRIDLSARLSMNHVEAEILELVARLYPDVFRTLDAYCAKNGDYLDQTISVFDREIQFYVAYLQFIARLKQAGLPFCYPQVSSDNKEVYDYDGFDIALAHKRVAEHGTIVTNDFYLQGPERIFVVSGPNQGGKTTFARAFGQLHYLASLGCPVPGSRAQLFLFDSLFTHFEKEESIRSLRGKLQDDLVRIHAILDQATPNSIVVMNEIFTSTTLSDAVFLIREVIQRLVQLDVLCVCVTFIDELASFSEQTVSMVSTVDPANPAVRTFKIVRRPADGLAYAMSIAEKYHLTYDSLKARIPV